MKMILSVCLMAPKQCGFFCFVFVFYLMRVITPDLTNKEKACFCHRNSFCTSGKLSLRLRSRATGWSTSGG